MRFSVGVCASTGLEHHPTAMAQVASSGLYTKIDPQLYTVTGGFHLVVTPPEEVERVAAALDETLGVDRWGFELALKYGMRDGFMCPVGGRWVIAYWSKRDLSNVLTPTARILLQAASSFAAQRLEHLTGLDVKRVGLRSRLTAREIAVLRLVSMGRQASEIAKGLGLGEETVRSHLKKAQVKLGARNRAHAACEALRQNLIP